MLVVRDLVVAYGPIRAVQGVDLDVNPGELVALIGPNGAGKSSTLNAIVGSIPSQNGSIRFETRELRGMPPEQIVRLGLALTPEGRRLFPRLTVEDNLLVGGITRPRGRQAAADRLIDRFPILRERRHQPAGTLSGGEQQQLAIARSLMSAPRLLLLDEPSLGLAPKIVTIVLDLVAELRREGLTVLLVEQSVKRALAISDRAYVLAAGRVVAAAASGAIDRASIERAYLGITGDR